MDERMSGQMLRIITEKQVRSCRFAPKRVELLYMKYRWFIIDISCECLVTATENRKCGALEKIYEKNKRATNRRRKKDFAMYMIYYKKYYTFI